jgi:hypothetical protein
MRNFNEIHIKPMIFKNMSSNFLRNIQHPIGHIGIYRDVQFSPENRNTEKPMIRFAKITTQGDPLCTSISQKIRFCVYRRFSPSFPSAEAHGGPDARAGAFPNPSKSVLELPRGKALTFSRFWKKSPAGKAENDHRQRHFVFPFHPSAFSILRERADGHGAIVFQPLRGP